MKPRSQLTDAERLTRHRIRVDKRGYKPKPCEICGAEPAERHHIDYSAPERVMWLCTKHHHQTHSQFGKPAPDWMADIRAAQARIWQARLALRSGAGQPPDQRGEAAEP